MGFFGRKKREDKKQQSTPGNREGRKIGDRFSKQTRTPDEQNQKLQQRQLLHLPQPYDTTKGTSSMKAPKLAPPTQFRSTPSTASQFSYQHRPVYNNATSLYTPPQEKKSAEHLSHKTAFVEKTNAGNAARSPLNTNITKTSVETQPRSILHTHEPSPQQSTFTMGASTEVYTPNRVRFLSSNSSVASSSCASEVHLMAGPGSVASSSAMSSNRGEGQNVFDRVLHSVMIEEEDRLKAMGMSNAGSSTRLSPPMYYKTSGSSFESDELYTRATMKPAGVSKIVSTGRFIDIDTGVRVDSGCSSGNIETEYHDLNDDAAIDEQTYRNLLYQGSIGTEFNESSAFADF